ncbi:MAG: TROVE domain-containing protein [Candidatus Methanomethylophilaceae archaeon]|nr:TROVE domain-containing protein [Candidatus Methanomethylophilaceae archaeon]
MNFNQILTMNQTVPNHEGAKAFRMTPEMELYTAIVTSTLEDTNYEDMPDRIKRIESLVGRVNPEFVAKLAVYARTKMNLRSIPLVLLTLLAKVHNGDDLLSRAVAETVIRPDEIPELLQCYQWLNPSDGVKKLGKLSKGIQNGLKEAFNRFDEYQFAKYNREGAQVSMKDALFIVHPKAKDAAQQALFDKIVAGTLDTPYTWETELSALGQQHFDSPEEKAAAFRAKWEELIASRKVGYMATLRNLRNILDAGVGPEYVGQVCGYISDPSQVARSRQFLFRYLSAYRELLNHKSPQAASMLTALEKAVESSAENIAGFGSGTNVLVASDVSGSMHHPVSRNSTVENYDVGIVLSMLLQSRCGSVVSGIFGDVWKVVNLPRTGILANSMRLRDLSNRVGYSTNGHLVIDWLVENRVRMDKVMMFTDCQLWDSGKCGAHLQTSWKTYRRMYPEAKLYLFDLAGYGQAPIRLKENGVTLIAGWSDRIFDILDAIENGSDAIAEIMKTEL